MTYDKAKYLSWSILILFFCLDERNTKLDLNLSKDSNSLHNKPCGYQQIQETLFNVG